VTYLKHYQNICIYGRTDGGQIQDIRHNFRSIFETPIKQCTYITRAACLSSLHSTCFLHPKFIPQKNLKY